MQDKTTWQPWEQCSPAALPQPDSDHLPLSVPARLRAVCVIIPLIPFRWAASGAACRHGSVHILHFWVPGGCQSELWGEWRNSPGWQTLPPIPGENLPSLAWKWRYVELDIGFTAAFPWTVGSAGTEKAPSLWVMQSKAVTLTGPLSHWRSSAASNVCWAALMIFCFFSLQNCPLFSFCSECEVFTVCLDSGMNFQSLTETFSCNVKSLCCDLLKEFLFFFNTLIHFFVSLGVDSWCVRVYLF